MQGDDESVMILKPGLLVSAGLPSLLCWLLLGLLVGVLVN